MSTPTHTSDSQILELLRQSGAMSVTQIASATEVTSTAVRQRLARLMSQELVQREASRQGRGRPSHRYALTEKARRQIGTNFSDLAMVLWDEIRGIKDPEVRRGLYSRIANGLAKVYAGQMTGESLADRMKCIAGLFGERNVPMDVSIQNGLPVLNVLNCPYPELADRDRGICAVEQMLFERLLETDVRLSQDRFCGHPCCQFAVN